MKKLLIILFLSPLSAFALDFDGVDDYVNAGSDVSIENLALGSFTVSAWIRPRTTGDSSTGRIANKRPVGAAGGWLFFTDDIASIGAQTVDSGATTEANSRGADNAIAMNRWNHVAMTYSDSGDKIIRLYVSSREISYETQTAGLTSPGADTGGNLIIGDSTNDFIRSFNGNITDLRVYNRVLTISELRTLYYGTAIRNGLRAYWQLLGNSQNYAPDLSGNKNGGVLTNGPARGPLSPFILFRR
jgi:hypothetical protein